MEKGTDFTTGLIIQYSIVGLILLVTLGWMLWKMFHKNKDISSGGCSGCGIADSCKKKNILDNMPYKDSENNCRDNINK